MGKLAVNEYGEKASYKSKSAANAYA